MLFPQNNISSEISSHSRATPILITNKKLVVVTFARGRMDAMQAYLKVVPLRTPPEEEESSEEYLPNYPQFPQRSDEGILRKLYSKLMPRRKCTEVL
jgi:hypothetical protein